MQNALEVAREGALRQEIPIGAVLVRENRLVASAHNLTSQNPLAHAEKRVIEEVLRQTGEKFLYEYDLFVTIEPCIMCAGIIIWSRLGRVFFGATDEKAGAAGSVYNALRDKAFNHRPQVFSGICAAECADVMTRFFKDKRENAESCRSG